MDTRQIRGQAIYEKQGQIERNDSTHYFVKSQSSNGRYDVISTESGWTCSCPDHRLRQVCCKHIHAVEISLRTGKKAGQATTIKEISADRCKFCGSGRITKKGIKKTKHGDFQQFRCKDCGKRFIQNFGFEGMRATPQAITTTMNLYFNGESTRGAARSIRMIGVKVSHVTVQNWIKKYIEIMDRYIDQITPQVSERWRTDELYLRVRGDRRYLYAIMDDETRYWIARQVSAHKGTDDVRPMFAAAKKTAKKVPKTMVSDGAANFHEAWEDEYKAKNFMRKKTKHISHIHLKGDKNNNKMERLNGRIRDREKVMRSLKKDNSSIIVGMQLYYNLIMPHMGLGGDTPADRAGIKVEGDNKWITLIQNAKKLKSKGSTPRAEHRNPSEPAHTAIICQPPPPVNSMRSGHHMPTVEHPCKNGTCDHGQSDHGNVNCSKCECQRYKPDYGTEPAC